MNGQYSYLVLGAGRQGTAAAFDMASRGNAIQVRLADIDETIAQHSAERINSLLGKEIVLPTHVDVRDARDTERVLSGMDACLSAVPYPYNLELTHAAIAQKVSFCDLGGNTDLARRQHELNSQAQQAGVSVVPNCGQVPGLGTSLTVFAIQQLDEAVDVLMWDGGLPQHPQPPFHYLLTFNIAGLTNEYAEPAIFLRNWRITEVEPLSEVEIIEFPPPIGFLEAFVAGGGTDTMPWTYEGKLRTLQNLTLRFPGHYQQLKAYYDLGLWSLQPIQVNNQTVVPREVFHSLFEPKVTDPSAKDLVIVRVQAKGRKANRPAEALVELIDYFDESTGFTAMERGTGWSAAIVAEMMARGETPRGAGGVEIMVPAEQFVNALIERGLNVRKELRFVGD